MTTSRRDLAGVRERGAEVVAPYNCDRVTLETHFYIDYKKIFIKDI